MGVSFLDRIDGIFRIESAKMMMHVNPVKESIAPVII
jgi:hypothetical protein